MKPVQTCALVLALLFGVAANASPLGTAAAKLGTAAVKVGATVTKAQLAAFGAGLGAGIYVTKKLHQSNGFWARPIPVPGLRRYRMADLPVGGTLAVGAALLTRHDPTLSHILLSAGAGMTVGAVGTGLADPLPKRTASTK